MTPEIQNILIYAGVALAALFIFLVIAVVLFIAGRRLSRRYVGNGPSAILKKECSGNCGCNCTPAPAPGCIPALDCAPPYAHPIAIRGLTCDPSNPQFAYAGDVQSFVDAMNRQRETERQAESLARLKETVRWMEGMPETPATKVK